MSPKVPLKSLNAIVFFSHLDMLNYRRVTIMFIVSACCRWKIPWNWRCHLAEAANHLSSGKPTKKRWKITISNGWINDFTISKRYITTRFTINVDPARYPIAILETIWRNQNRSPRLVKNFCVGTVICEHHKELRWLSPNLPKGS
jgi:hypothetical protein